MKEDPKATLTKCFSCDKTIPIKGKHRVVNSGEEHRVCYSCYLKFIRAAEGRKRLAEKYDR